MLIKKRYDVISDARKIAYRLVSRKEYSRSSLSHSLCKKGYPIAIIESLMDELEQTGLLSDRRFVDSVIANKRSRYGQRKILFELKKMGLASSEVERARCVLLTNETEIAQQVWDKRFSEFSNDSKIISKRIRFMIGRGFSREIVEKIAFKNGFTK